MSYQVFARKYRPRTFDDVLGQDHVVRTLRNAITQNRLAHAYLFVGPRGTGKTSTARIFAKALNCPGGPKVDFDPDDELCIEIEKGIALDVREIDGASNNGVEQVRELREEVKFAPTRSRFKIYYIDEVHMLSTAAFNALLKTLEEPPEHVKFIFATTEAHKVLPTIISRCQRFDLRRIPSGIIAKHLLHIANLEKVALSEKAAYAIAKGAEGGMRDAQSMLDQLVAFCGEKIEEQDVLDIFGFTRGETVAILAQHVLNQDTVSALQDLHTQADNGRDLSRLLVDLIQHFRTLLVHQVDPAVVEEDLSPELTAMMRTQSAMVNAERILRVMDGLAEVEARMRWAANKLLHMEIGLIQSVQVMGEVSLSDVIVALGNGGEGLETKTVTRRAATPLPVVRKTEPAPQPVATPQVAQPQQPATPPQPVTVAAPLPVVSSPPVAKVQEETLPPTQRMAAEPPPPAPETAASVQEDDMLFSAPPSSPTTGEVSPDDREAFWKQLVDRVHAERPLLASWVDVGALQSIEGSRVIMGLPETEESARDNLLRPMTRKFLEGIFTEMLGKNVTLDVVLDPNLQPPPVSEMSFDLGDSDSSAPAKKEKPEAAEAPSAVPKAEPPKAAADPEFYKDPLIQAALTKFKATLVK